jgi:ubiquinone/menaquinone biosynthesis C-methylase UbiE
VTFKSRLYDLFIARRYDHDLEALTADTRQRCVDQLGVKEGDTVIDLGCGSGLNHPYLARALGNSGSIIGVDASIEMLRHAEERAARHGYGGCLHLIHGDARKARELIQPALQDGLADALLITLFFSVVPDWRQVFAGAFALLAPGGRCIVMDTYWPRPTWSQRTISWKFAADPTRPGFEPLQQVAADFRMEDFPPDMDAFYIASGTKPGVGC